MSPGASVSASQHLSLWLQTPATRSDVGPSCLRTVYHTSSLSLSSLGPSRTGQESQRHAIRVQMVDDKLKPQK